MLTATDIRLHLCRLTAERLDAVEMGVGANATYMAELDADIAETREAYVGLAVTEIASFRSQLAGPQLG
jgi:hypothetical protein